MKQTLSLNENRTFRRLYAKGVTFVSPVFAAYYFKRRDEGIRLGITVSKKTGCAVERNRLRRRIKEAYRLSEASFPGGFDLVIVARTRGRSCPFFELMRQMNILAEKMSAGGSAPHPKHTANNASNVTQQ